MYVLIAILADRESAWLAILIGLAVGFGFSKFGRTRGVVPGVLAALVTLALFLVAIVVIIAGYLSKELGASFGEALSFVLENFSLSMEAYFSDPLSYVFVAGATIVAFFQGAGLAARKIG